MTHVQRVLGVSERPACRVSGQPRSSQRFRARRPDRDRALIARMVQLSARHPGYRRIWALLRRERWPVNRKRVQRLWRQLGLRGPAAERKRRRLGSSPNSCTRLPATHKNHVWSYDLVMDQTDDGRRLKLLPVVDEFTPGRTPIWWNGASPPPVVWLCSGVAPAPDAPLRQRLLARSAEPACGTGAPQLRSTRGPAHAQHSSS